MKDKSDLKSHLRRIDGRGYKAYKEIKEQYQFDDYVLIIDHVQGDPFAVPSRMRVQIPMETAGFPAEAFSNQSRATAFCDFLTRCFYNAAGRIPKKDRGTGKSGLITIDRPGQEILERTSMILHDDYIEARFVMGLPAFGRKIGGRHAEETFFIELPGIVQNSLRYSRLDSKALFRHVETAEDADVLRDQLDDFNCIAFVANGAHLPRLSGIDDRPLQKGIIVPFQSPPSFEIEIKTPNIGSIKGMGISHGITLIVGGGYHGKSTLLSALEVGIYNHIPGDGRQYVVSHPDVVKIRAEDGRRVEKVSITPFISNLPFQKDTTAFSTDDASGSTSQAANIIEAMEIGTACLLIDEDTSATNFMIRDQRMQELVAKNREPITPFIDKVRMLYNEFRISTVLVIGGCGDYFDEADTVICMNEYLPENVTEQARSIAGTHSSERKREGGTEFGQIIERVPQANSFDPRRGNRTVKISEKGLKEIGFGIQTIDLGAVEQLVDSSQTRAIGDAILLAKKYMGKGKTLRWVTEKVLEEIRKKGLTTLNSILVGDYAEFRKFELASAINRLRTLVMEHDSD